MRQSGPAAAVIVALLLLHSSAARAHHGEPGYDWSRLTVLTATITEFAWKNPHSAIKFDAVDGSGQLRHWIIEAPPPNVLSERGWYRRSLKPGDIVTMYFNASVSGLPTGLMKKAVMANGDELWAYPPSRTP